MKIKNIFGSFFIRLTIFMIYYYYVGVTVHMMMITREQEEGSEEDYTLAEYPGPVTVMIFSRTATNNFINSLLNRGIRPGGKNVKKKNTSNKCFECISSGEEEEGEPPIKQFRKLHPFCEQSDDNKNAFCMFVKHKVLLESQEQINLSTSVFDQWQLGNIKAEGTCVIKTLKGTNNRDHTLPGSEVRIRALKCYHDQYVNNTHYHFYIIEGEENKTVLVAIPTQDNLHILYKLRNFEYDNPSLLQLMIVDSVYTDCVPEFAVSTPGSTQRTPQHPGSTSRTPQHPGSTSRTPQHPGSTSRTPQHPSSTSRTPQHQRVSRRTPPST